MAPGHRPGGATAEWLQPGGLGELEGVSLTRSAGPVSPGPGVRRDPRSAGGAGALVRLTGRLQVAAGRLAGPGPGSLAVPAATGR